MMTLEGSMDNLSCLVKNKRDKKRVQKYKEKMAKLNEQTKTKIKEKQKEEQMILSKKKKVLKYNYIYNNNNSNSFACDIPSNISSVTPTYGGSNKTPDTEYVQGVLNGSGPVTINGYGIEINGESE